MTGAGPTQQTGYGRLSVALSLETVGIALRDKPTRCAHMRRNVMVGRRMVKSTIGANRIEHRPAVALRVSQIRHNSIESQQFSPISAANRYATIALS